MRRARNELRRARNELRRARNECASFVKRIRIRPRCGRGLPTRPYHPTAGLQMCPRTKSNPETFDRQNGKVGSLAVARRGPANSKSWNIICSIFASCRPFPSLSTSPILFSVAHQKRDVFMSNSASQSAPKKNGIELNCFVCGKKLECSPETVLSYTRIGWPKCCGEVMNLKQRTEEYSLSQVPLDKRAP